MCFVIKFVFHVILLTYVTNGDYWSDRNLLMKREKEKMLGASIKLSDKEELVNKILMYYKLSEFDAGFEDPDSFAASKHFFDARAEIQNSDVFKLIRKMPKGGALHGHSTALVSLDFMHGLTFKENLYACVKNEKLRLKFLENSHQDAACIWTLLSTLRKMDPLYDKFLLTHLSLYRDNTSQPYGRRSSIWSAFEDKFATIAGLITYRPVFEEYFYEVLKELHEDNVMYLEFRGTLPKMYELNGTVYESTETLQFYQKVIAEFMRDYPKFLGARFIYSPSTKDHNETLKDHINTLLHAHKHYPKLLIGFDLVGPEDTKKPIITHLKDLKRIASFGIDFFFHAGETNWYETSSDFNIIDAILLGTKRIGHALALIKHPIAMELVKERQIAVEVCPISNQVLKLIDDMRNHPAATLIANGVPVVISYDDPTLWNGQGLSYDFYMTFMGIAGRNADLRLLKQLIKNSLVYSSLSKNEKELALKAWEKDWENFINAIVISENYKHLH